VQLTQRLLALGDLPEGTQPIPTYDTALQEGVKAFQQRHALAADGVVGRGTLAQMEVAPAQRARQITLAMEHLRWTPLQLAPRMIVVNVPEFMLRAYEVRDGVPAVALTMKVIVGKSVKTHTPLFDEPMRFIEFSPYWNVPPSIAREETVPRLRRDSAYFTQQGFEFVNSSGQAVTDLSQDHLNAVMQGTMRLRQRPGPRNALGTQQPFEVISGYRSPGTNATLRSTREGGVAKHSLHMDGKAIDVRLPGVPLADLRDAARSLRGGGVGFYPREQFVHIDTGRVRHW